MMSIMQTGVRNEGQAAAREAVETVKPGARRFPPLRIVDNGKVRLGGQGPCFRPAAIADAGRVRLGGQGPIFR